MIALTHGYDAIPLGSGEMDGDHCSNRPRELTETEQKSRDFWTSEVDLRVSKPKVRLSMISWGRPVSSMWNEVQVRCRGDPDRLSNVPTEYENLVSGAFGVQGKTVVGTEGSTSHKRSPDRSTRPCVRESTCTDTVVSIETSQCFATHRGSG